MPRYVTPGLYYETVDTAQKDIDPTRVDIPAFIGFANQGPLNQPAQINSQAQFQAIFGGFIPNSYLAYTVRAFFENGGTRCYVVRVASNTAKVAYGELRDATGQATLRVSASGPGSLGNGLAVSLARTSAFATQAKPDIQDQPDPGRSFVESTVGFLPGTMVKAFQAQVSDPIYRMIAKNVPGQNILTWDTPLPLPVANGFDLRKSFSLETVEFSLTVYLAGQLREVFPRLSFGFQDAKDKGKNKDNPYYIENAISEKTSQLIRIKVLNSSALLPDQLPDPARVKTVRLLYSQDDLDNAQRADLMISSPWVWVWHCGKDGLADVQPEDFIGDPTAQEKRGLRTLEDVPDVTTIAIPDLTLQPVPVVQTRPPSPPNHNQCLSEEKPLPGVGPSTVQPVEQFAGFSQDQVARVQQAMIDFCESQKRCMALLDPPPLPKPPEKVLSVAELPPPLKPPEKVLSVAEIQRWSQLFDSKYAALYYPQLLVYDPLKLGGQIVRAIPPCGHVAGMFARVDHETGVHRAPANEELNWVQGVSVDVTGVMQGILNPLGINCIRTFPGRGIRIYGARTLSSNPSWRYVNVRRLFIMLERSLEAAMQWTVFEPNDFALRQTLVATIGTFLETLWLQGAFAGSSTSDAFFVKIDEQNNPPELADQGRLLVEVGVAPAIPAEFVVFRIGLVMDKLEITE